MPAHRGEAPGFGKYSQKLSGHKVLSAETIAFFIGEKLLGGGGERLVNPCLIAIGFVHEGPRGDGWSGNRYLPPIAHRAFFSKALSD